MSQERTVLIILLVLHFTQQSMSCLQEDKNISKFRSKNLDKLPDYNFEPDVKIFDFFNNSITKFDNHYFDHYKSTEAINVSNNKIESIDENIFYNLDSLKKVDVSNNNLSNISAGAFANNGLLSWLSLANNKNLKQFPKLYINSLIFWNMSNCGVENVPRGGFDGISNIRVLDLSHNNIKTVPHEILSSLTSLEYIDISYNKFKLFEFQSWFQFKNLTHLDISNNQISVIGVDAKVLIYQLRVFKFKNNPWNCSKCEMFQLYHVLESGDYHINLVCDSPPNYKDKLWHFWANQQVCNSENNLKNETEVKESTTIKTTEVSVIPTTVSISNVDVGNVTNNEVCNDYKDNVTSPCECGYTFIVFLTVGIVACVFVFIVSCVLLFYRYINRKKEHTGTYNAKDQQNYGRQATDDQHKLVLEESEF